MSTTPEQILAKTALAPVFSDYVLRKQNEGRKVKSVANVAYALASFQQWLDNDGTHALEITGDTLYRYFGASVLSPGTKRVHATAIRAAYSYAFRRGIEGLPSDPFVDFVMAKPAAPDPREKLIPNAELRAMRGECRNDKQEILWALLVFTGMRRDEIRRLTWEAMNWDEMSFTVLGKGDKWRTVPIHPVLQEALNRVNPAVRPPGTPEGQTVRMASGAILSPNGLSGRTTLTGEAYADGEGFTKILRGFTDRPFHSFRKTLATSLARNGVDSAVIDKIFGWAPVGVREQYYHGVEYDRLHAGIRKAYANDPVAA